MVCPPMKSVLKLCSSFSIVCPRNLRGNLPLHSINKEVKKRPDSPLNFHEFAQYGTSEMSLVDEVKKRSRFTLQYKQTIYIIIEKEEQNHNYFSYENSMYNFGLFMCDGKYYSHLVNYLTVTMVTVLNDRADPTDFCRHIFYVF